MRALLNLNLVALYLGGLGGVLGMTHGDRLAAGVSVALGLLIARICYRAAITQGVELARAIWAGFELYRFETLKQMDEPEPETIAAERALWPMLAARLDTLEEPTEPA